MSYELRPPEHINLADEDTGREHISHSALGTFLACQQRYGWSYDQRLEPAVTSKPLELGRAFAHALELGDPVVGEQLLRADANEQAARAAGSPWIVAPNPDQVDIDATIVREAARAYLNTYGTTTRREVEIRIRIRNPEAGGRYSRTHDLLCRVDGLSTDGLELIEDKLLAQIPAPAVLTQRLKLDRQVTIGCYAHWRATGQHIQQVRYQARPEFYLLEEPVTREPDDYLRLEQELWTWVEQIRQARHTNVWPRNTAACFDYGGCAFLPLCAREPGAMHSFRPREPRPVGAPEAPVCEESSLKEAA